MSERSFQLDELIPLIEEQLEHGQSVRFAPKGTSMLPMLRQGIDSVVLSPLPEQLRKYDLPLYRRKNGQYILHRVVGVGDCYTCIGDNQFEYEKGVEQTQMIGVVTAFFRDEKEYKVNALSYRLYCRFWHYSRPIRLIWRRIKRKAGNILKKQ